MDGELFEVDGDERVVLRLHVQPGAGRSEIVGRHGDALKVRVAAAPEGGRANEACTRLLAEVFEVEPSAVALVAGRTSRSKRYRLDGVGAEEVRDQLARTLSAERPAASDRRGDHRPTRR